jgi:tagaturonate reductase
LSSLKTTEFLIFIFIAGIGILSFTHSDDASILIIDETIDQSLLEIGRHGQRLPQTLLDKLLKLLLERYAAFQGRPGSGMLILSTGSLTGYAYRLEAHILELAHVNRIAPEFLDWIEHANYFCDPWMD